MNSQFIIIFALTTLYSVIRYNVIGPVSLENIPVFILNKSISFSAAAYLALAAYNAFKAKPEKVRYWGRMSFYMSAVHCLLSLSIYSSAYFPKLFGAEKMSIWGEMMILSGVLCLFTYWYIPKSLNNLTHLHNLHLYACLLLGFHLFFLGARGWTDVSGWSNYGYLPPITLLSFIFAAISLVLFTIAKRNNVDLTAK